MTATQPIKSIRLEAPSASGKKFYSINVHEVEGGHTVDFVYGAIGGSVKTGTKTPKPVPLDKAEAIFDKLIKEKVTGESHYQPVNGPSTIMIPAGIVARTVGGFVISQTHDPLTGEPLNGPTWIPPRLLNDVDESQVLNLVKLDNWWVQIKHDGDRVQLHSEGGHATLFSGRSAKTRACPQAIVEALKALGETFVLDGELVDQTLWVFDLLATRDQSRLNDPYTSRYGLAEAMVQGLSCPSIKIVDSAIDEHAKAALIIQAKETSAEGVVFINKNAPYKAGRPNRGGDNLRWKFVASGSFIVHSLNHEKGKASIDVALYDGTVIGTCSMIGREPVEIGQVVEVAYLYCLDKLVQARLKGIRTDVPKIACNRRQLKFRQGIDPKGK